MTYLEKAMEIKEVEGKTKSEIINAYCPYGLGLENVDGCRTLYEGGCTECWNREMPETNKSVLLTMDKETELNIDKKIKEQEEHSYNQGLNDAWELAKKLIHFEHEGGFSDKEIQNIFDCDEWQCVFDAFTPQEAIAKLKAYEDSKIEVGDVVEGKGSGKKAIVTRIDGSYLDVITNSGGIGCWNKDVCKKTGKHIDIQSILEQIGE